MRERESRNGRPALLFTMAQVGWIIGKKRPKILWHCHFKLLICFLCFRLKIGNYKQYISGFIFSHRNQTNTVASAPVKGSIFGADIHNIFGTVSGSIFGADIQNIFETVRGSIFGADIQNIFGTVRGSIFGADIQNIFETVRGSCCCCTGNI